MNPTGRAQEGGSSPSGDGRVCRQPPGNPNVPRLLATPRAEKSPVLGYQALVAALEHFGQAPRRRHELRPLEHILEPPPPSVEGERPKVPPGPVQAVERHEQQRRRLAAFSEAIAATNSGNRRV
jgi:hypothetical protein